jgi:hypothetical protein
MVLPYHLLKLQLFGQSLVTKLCDGTTKSAATVLLPTTVAVFCCLTSVYAPFTPKAFIQKYAEDFL